MHGPIYPYLPLFTLVLFTPIYGREMGSRLDEEDSVAVAERVECIVESLLPDSYRDQISDEL